VPVGPGIQVGYYGTEPVNDFETLTVGI